jgi:hypothetical protein
MSRAQQEQMAEWFRDVFMSDWTKLLLSTLIILSVLPFEWVHVYGLVFFLIFAVELFGRYTVLRQDYQNREISRVEIIFFCLDVVATLSFLPFEWFWDDVRFLRLFRLSRMLLLLGYWGPMVREIWLILAKRERRYQLFFAGASVIILSFLSAILLFHFQSRGIDFNEDGKHANESFWDMLWWSFRQIEDPGNLVKDVDATLGFFCSLVLTLAGLFVFSFIIGIAASVVEELVKVGRERRLGYRRHSVICNLGPYSRVLLEELVAYYAKSLRSPRIVTMGPAQARYSYMYEAALASIRYREGQPLNRHDLEKVDADRATRVILLGQRDRDASDSEVVSQILSVRELNDRCDIYAELFRGDNLQATLMAGGPRTVPIQADRLVGLFLAQIVSFPGLEAIFGDLLSSRGNEIYTCLFDYGAMAGKKPPSGPLLPFGDLLERGHRAHNVILLGPLVADESERVGYSHRLNPRGGLADPAELRGFFGVAPSFERLKDLVLSLPDVAVSRRLAAEPRPVPRMAVCPQAGRVKNMLICGFHDGLVDFCEQLILINGSPKIYIMVADETQHSRVVEAFLERPEVLIPAQSVEFEQTDVTQIRYWGADDAEGEGEGIIQLLTGDWSHERVMIEGENGFRLVNMDAVLLTFTQRETDPDARTSLGLLKLINLDRTRPDMLRPNLRILCEVQNGEKAALLEKRFGHATGGCHPVSVVSAEAMRNALLAQGVFVPGIDIIYRELLSEAGQEICKLVVVSEPEDPEMVLTFGDLLTTLYQREGLIAVAVELSDRDGRRVVVNPPLRCDDYRFRVGDIAGVFVVGEYNDLPRAKHPCVGCPTLSSEREPEPESKSESAPESES